MAERDDPNDPATLDWGEDANTSIDEVGAVEELAEEPITAPHPVTELPGYEVGWVLSRRRALADAMEVFRLELIEGGTDPGIADVVATKFGAKCGLRYC